MADICHVVRHDEGVFRDSVFLTVNDFLFEDFASTVLVARPRKKRPFVKYEDSFACTGPNPFEPFAGLR